jgi:hypothetical protein
VRGDGGVGGRHALLHAVQRLQTQRQRAVEIHGDVGDEVVEDRLQARGLYINSLNFSFKAFVTKTLASASTYEVCVRCFNDAVTSVVDNM